MTRPHVYAIVAALAAASALSLSVSTNAQESLLIYGDLSIGGFRPYEKNGRLSQAIAVFGEPIVRRVRDAEFCVCRARWPDLGLTMLFAPFGNRGSCTPERSCFYEATITGVQWRTSKGLRIGDERQRLYRLYPNPRAVSSWRILLTRPGFEGTYPAVKAKLVARRVVALRIFTLSCEGFLP